MTLGSSNPSIVKRAMSVTGEKVMTTFGGYGLIVNVLRPVIDVWETHRQLEPDSTEGCGVLIGSVDQDRSRIWVEQATTPQLRDQCTRTSFEIIDPYHQNAIKHAHRRSQGRLFYLGTWHTHPEPIPTASNIDIQDWHACVDRNRELPRSTFVIIGKNKDTLYIPQHGVFLPLYFQPRYSCS